MDKQWKKINPQEWPELKRAKWTKNIFAPTVLDTVLKIKGQKTQICFDRYTKEYFIFC